MSRIAPCAPIYTVEVIDEDGFGWLYARLTLIEALRVSGYFEAEAAAGREPRISIPPALVGTGLTEA